LGVVNDVRWAHFEQKREAIAREQERLKASWVNPNMLPEADAMAVLGQPIEREYSLIDLLRRPQVSYTSLMTLPGVGPGEADPQVIEQVEIQAKYAGYILRQQDEVERSRGQEELKLPLDMDYREVRGLSIEVSQKLNLNKPETLGQAGRISGVTPAAISLLLVHLKRGSKKKSA
jgi:tRNA uridine 5-carboxymethylaminomethyl modification enzyme